MIKIFRHSFYWLALLLTTGCATSSVKPPEQPKLSAPEQAPFNLPVNVYSSYISDEVEQQCNEAALTSNPCKNDGIPANDFLKSLEKLDLFAELSPSVSRHDYELLIANQVADMPAGQAPASAEVPLQSYTEFAVEWRGVHLDSFLVHYWHDGIIRPQDVEQIILRWSEHANRNHIFSTPFLYQAMGASDYTAALNLPKLLGEFQLARQFLYPDPFKGVLARYLHPSFSEAIMDIAIYPVLAPLTGDTEQLISHELEDAVEQAKQIAVERAMAMEIKKHQQAFSQGESSLQGLMSEIAAEGESGEALYATIYIFRLEDKFVKFSTTFPSRIGDPLVSEALTQLAVPGESALMKELRKAL